jgi:hypothetical protein
MRQKCNRAAAKYQALACAIRRLDLTRMHARQHGAALALGFALLKV